MQAGDPGNLGWVGWPASTLVRRADAAAGGFADPDHCQSSSCGSARNRVNRPQEATLRRVEEATFRTHDGVDLFYRHWPVSEPRGAIVIFHRGHEHSGRVGHLPDELDLPEFAVFAWDARGHGRSPGARGFSPSLGTSVRDVGSFIAHITREHGIAEEDVARDQRRQLCPARSRRGEQESDEVADDDVAKYTVVRVADEIVVGLMARACGLDYAEASRDARTDRGHASGHHLPAPRSPSWPR